MREQARFKLYLNMSDSWRDRLRTDGSALMKIYANYSQPSYVDGLNKENQRRLRTLMDPTFPMYKLVDGIGYKMPYKYAKQDPEFNVVYVIDGTIQRAGEKDTNREQIHLRRVRWSKVPDWEKCLWTNGNYIKMEKPDAWVKAMKHEYPNPVFMDRLTKKEKDKLSMLLLLPDNKYLEGFGSARTAHDGKRMYYLEVEEDDD